MKKPRLTPLVVMGMLALANLPANAKIEHLLPRPQQVTPAAGAPNFLLERSIRLEDATNNAMLQQFLQETGCTHDENATATVRVQMAESIADAYDFTLAGFPNEGYTLNISENEVTITAVTSTGVTRAAQTLAQLAQGWEGGKALEALQMTDWPAFKVRGFMHDVGRSFVSVEQLKRQIDMLARFKVNLFHWHLTENQAWRFEVKQYPQLTSAASMTRFAGKFYTQEDCKEVQQYANERGITIIPEIDMPGHSAAFKRAMGHSMQTPEGVEELQNILEEVAQVFDQSTYIHIGADEETISYPNFLETMIDKVHSLGKKVMVWNPIRGVNIANLKVDMTQMWSSSGKAIDGVANIDCRYNYTNHFDVFADLVGIYKSNIYYKERGDATVPGFISAPWNDRKTPNETDILRQNNVYAATIASAERAWTGGGKQYIETGGTTLPNSGEEYAEFADWERRFLFHKANTFTDSERALIPYVKQCNVRWRITDAMPNGGNASKKLPPETEGLQKQYTLDGQTYATGIATGAGIYLKHTWGSVVPTYFSNPQTNTTAYAWTYVYSPVEQTAGAFIEFQNYGRSENDKAPDAGKWDRKGSRLWVNDKVVMPPAWNNTGKAISSEVDLRNENYTARKPTQIKLQQGWNKVFLRLPYVNADGVRLNKWMFTFVLTDVDGNNALEDIIYSPNQCLDEAAEQVSNAIDEARKFRNSQVSDQIGYYAAENASQLDKVLAEIEQTLNQEMDVTEREAQMQQIAQALNDFKEILKDATLVMPNYSTDTDIYDYSISTPFRDNRYTSSTGVGKEVVGQGTLTDKGKWKFVSRTATTVDIINLADDSYLSPTATNNTALKTSKTKPGKGWTLKASDQLGYFIITSGTTQLNQTKSDLGYKIYNWGNGTNTTDTGCKFLIAPAELPSTLVGIQPTWAKRTDGKAYDLSGRPVALPSKGVFISNGKKIIY